jgi:hypothetical protein
MSPVSSLVKLFRFFTSFVSCSVFCLSFSSFCCPSVDTGRVASLPDLGLIVFGKLGLGGLASFWAELGNNKEVGLRQAAILWLCGQALQLLRELCVL